MPAKKKTETAPVAAIKKEAAAVVKTETSAPAEAAKKTPAKKTEPKVTVKVQFAGNEYDIDQITKDVAKAYKGSVKGEVKSVEIYIKPEDGAVYYVVDSENTGKVEL